MKRQMVDAFAGLLLAVGLCAGCSREQPVLHIYTWADYIAPELIAAFEKAQDCQVVVDTFDTNEAMFKRLKSGEVRYDLMTPSSYLIPAMAKAGMIRPLDKSLVPNVMANFDRSYEPLILDPTMKYSVPYVVTYTGVIYRKEKVGGAPVNSWRVYETEALKGRMTLLSDMRETIGAALKCLGHSLNSADPKEIGEAADLVIRWKRNIAELDNEQFRTDIASSRLFVGHGYSTDAIQLEMDSDQVGFSLPKEGFSAAFDEFVVAAETPCPELAHRFIDFLYDAGNARKNIEFVLGAMPIAPALAALEPELRSKVVIPLETMKRGEVIRGFDDRPEVSGLYEKAWERIQAAK